MAPDNPLRHVLSPTATDGSSTGITYTAEPMADLLKRLRPAGAKRKARGQTGGFGRARWKRLSKSTGGMAQPQRDDTRVAGQ